MAKQAPAADDDDELDSEIAAEKAKEAELEKGRMPFLAHLIELRDRVRNAAIIFGIAFVVCWYFADYIFDWLKQPLFNVWYANPDLVKEGSPALAYQRLTEPFWVTMSIGMWAGIFLSSPFMFYQIWKFIAPGLYKRERKVATSFAVFSGIFFVGGAVFCFYFVLPNLYGFLISYTTAELHPQIMMQDYLDLTRDMMIAFGAVFELPLLIYFLAMIGLVTHRGLWKFNRWFIVLAFIIGAILTPSPDAISQIMMATPMIVLYNLSIVLAWRVTKKREEKKAALEAKEKAADERARARRKRVVEVEDDEE